MRKVHKKLFAAVLTGVIAVTGFVGCGSSGDHAEKDPKKIIVGASPSPHGEILRAAKDVLKREGYELEIKEYSDYIQPNTALEAGDLDANYFQHKPYLDNFNKENATDLISAGVIHYEPFGIFPGKIKSLQNLKDGTSVAVPNDTTNEARALLLLESQGLIKLKEGVSLTATKKDIVENKKNLNIQELEAAQIPRSLEDVDIAVINGNYALEAGLEVNKDALAVENAESLGAKTYGNVVAVKKGKEDSAAVKALIKTLKSNEVKEYIQKQYKGAVVALF